MTNQKPIAAAVPVRAARAGGPQSGHNTTHHDQELIGLQPASLLNMKTSVSRPKTGNVVEAVEVLAAMAVRVVLL